MLRANSLAAAARSHLTWRAPSADVHGYDDDQLSRWIWWSVNTDPGQQAHGGHDPWPRVEALALST